MKLEVENLRNEVRNLKTIMNQMISNKLEEEHLHKEINDLKAEVESLRNANKDTDYRIRIIEEEMESESDDEDFEEECELDGMFSCEVCGIQFGVEKYFQEHIKEHESEIRKVSSTRGLEESESNPENLRSKLNVEKENEIETNNNHLAESRELHHEDKEKMLTLDELCEEYGIELN